MIVTDQGLARSIAENFNVPRCTAHGFYASRRQAIPSKGLYPREIISEVAHHVQECNPESHFVSVGGSADSSTHTHRGGDVFQDRSITRLVVQVPRLGLASIFGYATAVVSGCENNGKFTGQVIISPGLRAYDLGGNLRKIVPTGNPRAPNFMFELL